MENKIIFKNTVAQTQELIDKLANDDAFREKFEKDAKKTLAQFNIILPQDLQGMGGKLPSKTEMQKMQRELIDKQPLSSVVPTTNAHYFALFAFFVLASAGTPAVDKVK